MNHQTIKEKLKTFMDKLEVWNPECIYKNLDLVTSLAGSDVTIENYMNWLNIEDKIEQKRCIIIL